MLLLDGPVLAGVLDGPVLAGVLLPLPGSGLSPPIVKSIGSLSDV